MPPIRNVLLAVAFALIAVAVLALRPVATPGPMLRDFEAYWSAGSTFNAHGDPYGRAVWDAERSVPGVDASRDELLPFVGPPATLWIWSAFARLPYALAARLWYGVLACALLGTILVCLRGARERPKPFVLLGAIALAVAFGPVTSDLALGQVALLAFFAAALVALPGAVSSTAAFVATFQPNVAPAMLTRLGRNRATLAIVTGIFAAYVVGAMAAGADWPIAYARALAAHRGVERFSAIQVTPAAIAHGLGASDAVATAAAIAVAAIAIATAVFFCIEIEDGFVRFAACSALLPFVATFFHEHDLLVAFPAAAFCALRARGTARAIGLGATLLVAVDWLGMSQRPSGIAQSACLAAAAGCAFVALGTHESELRARAGVAVAFAALFVMAAAAAAAHPSPVWPDALGAFNAPRDLPVAAVWGNEQTASGLLAVVPVWSFLRALSLAGCAALAFALVKCPRPAFDRTRSTRRDGTR